MVQNLALDKDCAKKVYVYSLDRLYKKYGLGGKTYT